MATGISVRASSCRRDPKRIVPTTFDRLVDPRLCPPRMDYLRQLPDSGSVIAMTHPPLRFLTALPVYNEASHVDAVLDEVVRYAADVLVVDDGSTDGTAERLAARRRRVLSSAIRKIAATARP